MSEIVATDKVQLPLDVDSDSTPFPSFKGPTDEIVLFNRASGGYAFWVGCEIYVMNNKIFHFPYVVETGYSSEFIGTLREFKKRYEFVGVL